jgi:hypothetical protein
LLDGLTKLWDNKPEGIIYMLERYKQTAKDLREVIVQISRSKRGAILTRDIGHCHRCGDMTPSGMLHYCQTCLPKQINTVLNASKYLYVEAADFANPE